MNLTNEDRELLDRHFEQDLTEPEVTQLQRKLAEDDEFRQAFRLRELIHERIRAQGAAQLKATLKTQLAAQRAELSEEETRPEAPVRSLFGSRSAVRWAVAASVGIAAATAIFLTLRNDPEGAAPIATQDTVATEPPVSQPPPSYAGTDAYTTTYAISADRSEQIAYALLIVDESRDEAVYRVGTDTLFLYYPQYVYAEKLVVEDSADVLLLQVNEDRYQLDPNADTEQPLRPVP